MKFFENNPRKITKKQFEQLSADLEEFGDLGGIVHDIESDQVISGNQRCRVLDLSKIQPIITEQFDAPTRTGTVAVGYVEWRGERFSYRAVRWTPEQCKAANIIANVAGGSWDWDILSNSWDADLLKGVGFDDDLLKDWQQNSIALGEMLAAENGNEGKDTEPQISRADELQKIWQVQLGDMFECGPHRIICGDCTDKATVEKVMGREKADLVFTDPPYGVAIGDKNKFLNTFQPSGRCLENIAGDLMGKDELLDMLVKSFTLTREFMNDCCAIYVAAPQGGELGLMMMMMMMMMSDLPVRHVLNWVKNAPTFSMGRLDYEYKHEPILYTWKETHKYYGNGKFNTSVWEIDKPRENKEHPTMKPVELVENAILNSSDTNQIVYDPFLGSGTTLIACQNLNRRCRGIELEPKYCSVILQRFLDHTGIEPIRLTPAQP